MCVAPLDTPLLVDLTFRRLCPLIADRFTDNKLHFAGAAVIKDVANLTCMRHHFTSKRVRNSHPPHQFTFIAIDFMKRSRRFSLT